MKNQKMLSIAMSSALALSLGLVACGGSNSTSTSASTEEAAESTEEAAESTEEAAESTEEAVEEESAEEQASTEEETDAEESTTVEKLKAITEGWTTAYMGVSEAGETYYYAESEDGAEGIMCVLNPETGEYVSFVGATDNPEEGYLTITDEATGNSLTFEVTAAEDGALAIDLGDYGAAVLAECTMDEVIDAFAKINDNGTAVDVADDTEEATDDESADTDEDADAESTSADAIAAMTEGWTTAYMGVSEAGETYYYAESEDGSEGIMCVLNPETGEYVSFVGATDNPEEGYLTITDNSTGNSLTFEVTAAEDGALAIDLGDYGAAVLAECDITDVVNAFSQINDYGEAVA